MCRGEAEYPAVFDYGVMGTTNVLAWDFAKLEAELTRVLLPPLLDDPAVLEALAGKSGLRPKPPKATGVPTEAAERADRLRAFLRFQELLHDLTVRVKTQSAAEPIRPLAHPPTGLAPLDRLLAVLLRVRKEAALCLGFGKHARQNRWRDEYYFALAVQGLLNAKADWDYTPPQVECALVAAGVALARMQTVPKLLHAAAEAGVARARREEGAEMVPPDVPPFPSYRVPLAVIYGLWSAREHRKAAEFAELTTVGPTGADGKPVIHPAARHAVPLQTAAALAQMEVGAADPLETLLDQKLRPLAREFADFETLARIGRLFKEYGDRMWAEEGIPFAELNNCPAAQMYKKALAVYAEAYEATDDWYVGINVATLALLTHDTKSAVEYSEKVAKTCAALHDTVQQDRYWLFVTEGEAALVRGPPRAGEITDAVHFYTSALHELTPGKRAWADSTYRQLCRLWKALGDDRVVPLLKLFETHRVARPSLTLGFMGRAPAPAPGPAGARGEPS